MGRFFTGFSKKTGEYPQLWHYPRANLCGWTSNPFVTQVVKFFKAGNIPHLPTYEKLGIRSMGQWARGIHWICIDPFQRTWCQKFKPKSLPPHTHTNTHIRPHTHTHTHTHTPVCTVCPLYCVCCVDWATDTQTRNIIMNSSLFLSYAGYTICYMKLK